MTAFDNTLEGGTAGTGLTVANSGGASGSAFSAVESAATFSDERAHLGSLSMKLASSGVSSYGRWQDGTPAANIKAKFYVYATVDNTTGDLILFAARGGTATGTQQYAVLLTGASKLRVTVSATGAFVFTAADNFPLNQWVRVEVMSETGTSDSTGRLRVAYYLADSATAIADSGWLTGLNLRYSVTPTVGQHYVGKISTVTYAGSLYMDTIRVRSGSDYSTSFIGPEVTVLPTPVVTAGATTKPTTVGGSDGTQVVTWPAVAGASSYDSYRAAGPSAAQEDYVLVQAGVTSPYTFTGQSRGAYLYGIKAKA